LVSEILKGKTESGTERGEEGEILARRTAKET